MLWQHPHNLWLLAIPAFVALLLLYASFQRRRQLLRMASHAMLRRLLPPTSTGRIIAKSLLIVLALVAFTLALARPRFGEVEQQVVQRGVDIFVLLDVSRSMLAEDVAPNRLTRAKSDIVDLLSQLRGDRAGLIVFAGTPVLRVPLTNDLGFFRQVLEEVDCDSAPRGGSLIGDAIREAMQSMDESPDRDQVLVLITDGEDHDSFPIDAAKQAKERGLTIISVGLGDPNQGIKIPQRGEDGQLSYVQYNGQDVTSRLNEEVLRQIALETSGAYIPARTRAYDLGQIYDRYLANLNRSKMISEKQISHRERYQWFAGLGLLCLLTESLIARFPARRIASATVVVLIVGLVPAIGHAADDTGSDEAVLSVHDGLARFHAGDFDQAIAALRQAAADDPEDPRIAFDLACALAAARNWEEAADLYRELSLNRNETIAANALYNLGSIHVAKAKDALGPDPEAADPQQRKAGRGEVLTAVDYFRECLRMQPEHSEARHNLETLRIWVRHIEAVWRQRDRQERLAEMAFAEVLDDIEARQLALIDAIHSATANPDAPVAGKRKRDFQTTQEDLAIDTQFLAQKASQEFASLPPETVDTLLRFLSEAFDAMTAAGESLPQRDWNSTTTQQQQAVAKLNQLFEAIASLPALLTKAIAEQEQRIAASEAATSSNAQAPAPPEFDAWRQNRITSWSALLPQVARLAQEQLPAGNDADNEAETTDEESAPATTTTTAEQAALRAVLEKAIEIGPRIPPISAEAAEHLRQTQPHQALPPQREVLALLQEIAEALPPQQQQQQQQQQENGNPQPQDQDQQDQDQQSQDPQSSSPDDGSSPDGEDSEPQNEPSQSDERSEDSSGAAESQPDDSSNDDASGQRSETNDEQESDSGADEQGSPKAPTGDQDEEANGEDEKGGREKAGTGQVEAGELSEEEIQKARYAREQAMAILRRARQRAAKYREMERELQRQLARPRKTEKDW